MIIMTFLRRLNNACRLYRFVSNPRVKRLNLNCAIQDDVLIKIDILVIH